MPSSRALNVKVSLTEKTKLTEQDIYEDGFITSKEIQAILRMNPQQVQRWLQSVNNLRVLKIRGKYIVARADFENWINNEAYRTVGIIYKKGPKKEIDPEKKYTEEDLYDND
jgi:deoxyadenosine/deoxycytidine kinase